MSRQILIAGALQLAMAIGMREKAWNLTGKCNESESAILNDAQQYVMLGTDMNEVGKEIAMTNVEEVERKTFNDFGHWYCVFIKENGKLPDYDTAIEHLRSSVFDTFTRELSAQQDNILKTRLDRMPE